MAPNRENSAAARINVCFVGDPATHDRIPTALRYLMVGLIEDLFNVYFVTPPSDRLAAIVPTPATIVESRRALWPLSRWSRRRVVDALMERVRSERTETPVVVHALAASRASLAMEIAQATGADLVVSVWSREDLNHHGFSTALAHAAAIIAPSHSLAEILRNRIHGDKQIDVVPLGVTSETPGGTRAGLDSGHPTLVYAGALSYDARVDLLLRAARRAVLHHPGLLVFIIGKGAAEPALRQLAGGLEIAPQVIFPGRVESVRKAIASAGVFCLPSARLPHREELLHAMSAGLAILAAEGAPYDGLADDETAATFPDGNEDELARRLIELLDDPAAARRLGTAAASHVRTRHSVARMVAGHATVYRRLAAAHRTIPIPAPEK